MRGNNGLHLHEFVRAPGEKGMCGRTQPFAKAQGPSISATRQVGRAAGGVEGGKAGKES